MEVRKFTRWSPRGISATRPGTAIGVVEREEEGRRKLNLADLGPLMAYAMGKLASDRGLKKVEFLAIFDSELQHKNLVRYYKFIGCRKVRSVGEELAEDVPLRLLYGGVGTLMETDVEENLRRWANRFRSI